MAGSKFKKFLRFMACYYFCLKNLKLVAIESELLIIFMAIEAKIIEKFQ
jgi:hypothetical protein